MTSKVIGHFGIDQQRDRSSWRQLPTVRDLLHFFPQPKIQTEGNLSSHLATTACIETNISGNLKGLVRFDGLKGTGDRHRNPCEN